MEETSGRLLKRTISYVIFSLVGFLFCFCVWTGKLLESSGNIEWTVPKTLQILGGSLVLGVLLGGGVCCLLRRIAQKQAGREKASAQSCFWQKLSSKKVFWISFCGTVLCWLPTFLAYYPAICAYDTNIQTGQILEVGYNDHHPLAHTLLLECFMKLGQSLFGDSNTGVAWMALLQMLILAACFGWGIALLHKQQVRSHWLTALLVYAMVYPFHWFMSVSVIKDTLFSVFLLLLLLSLSMLLHRKADVWKPSGMDLLFWLSSLGMILFRNNGKYAYLLFLAVLCCVVLFARSCRRFWKRLFVESVTVFLVANLMISFLFSALEAQQGDRREMLSIPIQQMARCMLYHGGVGVLEEDDGSMEETDKALIRDFLLHEGYTEYRPAISDPVKGHTNTYVVRYRTIDFLKTYLQLWLQYPGDMLNAILAVDAGYLTPLDESHAWINVNGVESGLGYVQTRTLWNELEPRGIYEDSKFPAWKTQLEQWADRNAYLEVPILKYIFVPGIWLWAYLLLAGWLLINRRFGACVPLALVAGYFITLLLGPCVQLRYIYPIMIAFPFLALLGTRAVTREGREDVG